MAPAAVPLGKLVGLFVKTLAKPMAKQLKHQFVKQPLTRRFLISIGQIQHSVETRMTIWSSGYKVRSITKLDEDIALSRGADLFSEMFIFTVAGVIVVVEYTKSKEKEAAKEAKRLQSIRDDAARLQAKLDSLDKRLLSLEEYAKANRRSIVLGIGIGANAEYHEPDQVVPINDGEVDSKETADEEHETAGTVPGNAAEVREKEQTVDVQNENVETIPKSQEETQQSRRWWWPF